VPHAAGQAEAVTVTGLLPGTRYYFAVEAVDERGNQGGLGNVVTAVTLQGSDPIPPGQITDLRVTVSVVTDRSVQLTWTAKGDDGDTIGSATAFDIRYSHKKINNDTDFNNATQVTGEPIPGPPGTGHGMTVNLAAFQQMTSNTVYYFAIQAIDDGGNRSPLGTLTNSNVDGSCTTKCKVRTALRVGYNLVSVPLVPSPNDAVSIFGGLDGPIDCEGNTNVPCVYSWISTGVGEFDGFYQLMDPCPPNCIVEGTGYYFYTELLPLLTASGSDIVAPQLHASSDGHHTSATGHAHLALVPGYNIIGSLFKDGDVPLVSTNVRRLSDGGSCTESVLSFAGAVAANWVGNSIYVSTTADGSTNVPVPYDDGNPLTQDAVLQPWQGYLLYVADDDPAVNGSGTPDGCTYELVIPKP
jgi:predicted thioesterase